MLVFLIIVLAVWFQEWQRTRTEKKGAERKEVEEDVDISDFILMGILKD